MVKFPESKDSGIFHISHYIFIYESLLMLEDFLLSF